jgi:DNA invertase Pin-like site-specific DNA recombinase
MAATRKNARVIAYVRVSDTRGREDNLTSPQIQFEKIAVEIEQRHGWKIIHGPKEFEELDQSGGRLDRPKLLRAVEMVERGDADVIAVYMLSRFARSTAAAGLIERVETAGGEVLSVSEPALGGGTISGELMRNIMLSIDQHARKLSTVHRNNARERAVNEGRHMGPVPIGYRAERYVDTVGRDGTQKAIAKGKLVPDETTAPIVRGMFERSAAGMSKYGISRWVFEESGIQLAIQTTGRILRNRIYLGELRHGSYVNEEAHQALVEELTWKRAQRNGIPFRGDGTPRLLNGLLRCSGCRSAMRVSRPNGRRRSDFYTCRRAADGGAMCRAPASVTAPVIEEYVEHEYTSWLREQVLIAEAEGDNERSRIFAAELDAIDEEIAEWQRPDVRGALTTPVWLDGLNELRVKRSAKAIELEAEQEQRQLPVGIDSLEAVDDYFSRPMEERRRMLGSSISHVFVRTTGVKGRNAGRSVGDRVKLIWQPHRVEIPHPGRRFTAGPFTWD